MGSNGSSNSCQHQGQGKKIYVKLIAAACTVAAPLGWVQAIQLTPALGMTPPLAVLQCSCWRFLTVPCCCCCCCTTQLCAQHCTMPSYVAAGGKVKQRWVAQQPTKCF